MLQRLWLSQTGSFGTLEAPIKLSAGRDTVTLEAAGFSTGRSFTGLCCPTVPLIRRWRWTGRRFDQLPRTLIARVVMPNVIGMTFTRASSVLVSHFVTSVDWNHKGARPTERDLVVATSPRPGAVIHPPDFHVVVTTAPRR